MFGVRLTVVGDGMEAEADGTMPCDAPWPEEDVERFRRWIDAGMPG